MAALAPPLLGCGPAKAPKSAPRAAEPRWADAFARTPELFGVFRPVAMKRDATYGPFLQTILRVAQSRRDVGTATVLEAMAGADEVIVGASPSEPGDLVLVVRGVPAQLDPSKVEEAGHPLFRLVGQPHATVSEYEALDRRVGVPASLFVLPKRTWVIALGEAKARARQAFAKPRGGAVPRLDGEALAVIRLDGPSLVRRRLAHGRPAGTIESLGKKLASVTLALKPGTSGIRATLLYEDDDASAWAEHALKRVVELAAERPSLAWLKEAQVDRDGNGVLVTVPVPPRLLEELPRVTGGDFL